MTHSCRSSTANEYIIGAIIHAERVALLIVFQSCLSEELGHGSASAQASFSRTAAAEGLETELLQAKEALVAASEAASANEAMLQAQLEEAASARDELAAQHRAAQGRAAVLEQQVQELTLLSSRATELEQSLKVLKLRVLV
jgi:hypothetical protein